MGQIVDYSLTIATALTAAGVKATNNIRNAVPPCALVVPVPRIDYDVLSGGASATWTIAAIAAGPGDLTDAKFLEEALAKIATVVDLTTAEPGGYALQFGGEPKPAYLCTFQTDVTPEEE